MAQEVKNDIKKALQVNTIPLIAIMTAVTTVLTMLVKIPTPIRGYLNLSDTMIYFSAYAFGPWVFGYFIAGGILSGFGPALGEIAGNSFQMAVGLIVGFALFTAVRQAYPPLVRLGNLGIKAGE